MAEITLRRASRMQKSINDMLSGMKLTNEMSVSIFEKDPKAVLDAAEKALINAIDQIERMTSILAAIRAATAAANAGDTADRKTDSIAALLAEKAVVERRLQILKGIGGRRGIMITRPDDDEVTRRLEISRQRYEKADFGDNGSVEFGVISDQTLAAISSKQMEAKRRLDAISEQLLEINATVMIEVDDSDLAWLKEIGVV